MQAMLYKMLDGEEKPIEKLSHMVIILCPLLCTSRLLKER